MKICNQCGMHVDDNAMVCNVCGYRFGFDGANQFAPQNQYAQPNYYQNQAPQPVKAGPSGLSIVAFICSFLIAPVGLILGIVDLVKKSGRKKGLSIAAVILSSVGLFWWLLMIVTMVPQVVKYVEKTNVSCDMQLCDSIRTSILTASLDPSVISADYETIRYYSDGDWHYATELGGGVNNPSAFKGAINEIMGFDMSFVEEHIKSSYNGGRASGIQFRIVGNMVEVRILNSDRTGKKGAYGSDPIEAS